MLMRTDPFRDFDRLAQQFFGNTGTWSRPSAMPLDAYRSGDEYVIAFDLPGVALDAIELNIERNVLTVRAERVPRNGDWEMLASERPRGVFSRQLVLGDNLDLDRIESKGYAFQIETTYRALRAGFREHEIPITFADLEAGGSKMSKAIVAEAMWKVPSLRLAAVMGRLR